MQVKCAALVVVFVIAIGSVSCTLLQLRLFDESQSNLVCNDGSPGGYYHRIADPNRWVIHQQGGAWCWNKQNCEDRFKSSLNLMSSKSWKPAINIGGLFDSSPTNNPDFHNASLIYIGYCSSDSFSGNRTASSFTFGWHFRGKEIIQSVIHSLLPLGLATAPQVLLSGCSAGGSATLANLDFVSSLLPHLPNRKFRGHTDAGWFLYTKPMTQIPAPYEVIFKDGQALWGGIPDESCVKAGVESWKCYLGQFVYQYLETPVLVFEETEDSIQLHRNGAQPPWNAASEEYVREWRGNMTMTLEKLRPPSAVFAPACFWHCGTEGSEFWGIKLSGSGVSDRDALHEWFFNDVTKRWVDDCKGISCSTGCPS